MSYVAIIIILFADTVVPEDTLYLYVVNEEFQQLANNPANLLSFYFVSSNWEHIA